MTPNEIIKNYQRRNNELIRRNQSLSIERRKVLDLIDKAAGDRSYDGDLIDDIRMIFDPSCLLVSGKQDTPRTRPFEDTVRKRLETDPEFAEALAAESAQHHIACCYQVTGGLEPCDCPLSDAADSGEDMK